MDTANGVTIGIVMNETSVIVDIATDVKCGNSGPFTGIKCNFIELEINIQYAML